MKKYQLVNVITGWSVFLVAAITYLLTIEPTTSFWDCGEFITSAYKLEVGHPPGAPVFMLIGRMFTLFAFGDVTKVALMVNILSAMASAFTILFLFWTITHLARKAFAVNTDEIGTDKLIAIMAAGAVGALAYTFSDSFWFSAVEGEVYALSSLFTAVVFWAILKWENIANQPHSEKWLVLIAYLMGLSIGVHLLNLLAIPAIVFIYYFKKYEVTKGGIIKTGLIAIALLGVVQFGVIPGVPSAAKYFELLFTNGFGAPYNTGSAVYIVLLIAFVVAGIWYSHKIKHAVLNLAMVSFAVILIGYSSFALIIIRSSANTPMDQNNPDNVFDLVSYLNRDQYGDSPLAYGQYFNSPVIAYEDGRPAYIQKNGKYIVADHKVERVFQPGSMTIFPRMYSDQESPPHIQGYMEWTGLKEHELYETRKDENGNTLMDAYGSPQYDRSKPKDQPSFGDNLRYFFSYQIGHMYFRYFMWNFVGRQNDVQGHGEINNGNWISGISFIDALRLGPQNSLPENMKDNPGRNTYFFLPLLLGIMGMVFLFTFNQKDFWVVFLLFFMTGLAIILYLNQPPYQPRERDYSFAGSFYAFSIYIGFGVLLIYEFTKNLLTKVPAAVLSGIVGLALVPGIMAAQNWDDHDRSGRYTARDFAHNYLNSCAPNAILFTNGDNDTFPLWYAQEVEGIRTDVRVVNLSYLNTDWYIDQMKKKAYLSDPVPFSLEHEHYVRGKREILYTTEESNRFLNEKFEVHQARFQADFDSLYQVTVSVLEQSRFDEIQTKDFERIVSDNRLLPGQLIALVQRLAEDENVQKFDIDQQQMRSLNTAINTFYQRLANSGTPLDEIIKFIASDDPNNQIRLQDGNYHNYVPTRRFAVDANPDQVIATGTVDEKDRTQITTLDWDYRNSYIRKNDLMVLDLLASNNWERPIYFAITVGPSSYMQLEPYFQLEGLAYRVVPIKSDNGRQIGRIDTEIMYDNLMNKFKWGNIQDSTVYLDENNSRMLMNIRNNFARLADAFISEGKNEKAIEVLDFCTDLLPNERVQYNYYNILMAESYYNAGAPEKADAMIKTLADINYEELDYYLGLNERFASRIGDERDRSLAIMQELIRISKRNQRDTLTKELEENFEFLLSKLSM